MKIKIIIIKVRRAFGHRQSNKMNDARDALCLWRWAAYYGSRLRSELDYTKVWKEKILSRLLTLVF